MTDDIVGTIVPPSWVGEYGSPEVGQGFGLIVFFSNVLKLIAVAGGLFALFNFVLAGIGFISSQGQPEQLKQANNKIWNSLTGLIIIAASYTIAAIIGWLLFGDAAFIISPKITGLGG